MYQGLTKYIVTKYGGSLNLQKLTYQACARSPATKALFLLERELENHTNTTDTSFMLHETPVETK